MRHGEWPVYHKTDCIIQGGFLLQYLAGLWGYSLCYTGTNYSTILHPLTTNWDGTGMVYFEMHSTVDCLLGISYYFAITEFGGVELGTGCFCKAKNFHRKFVIISFSKTSHIQ